MANRILKHVWLVDVLRQHGRLTMKEINNLWLKEDPANLEIGKREFHRWRNTVEELCDVNILCEHKSPYYYYIEKPTYRREIKEWMLDMHSLSDSLKVYRDMTDAVLLENIPGGVVYFGVILKAIKWRYRLCITYQGFDRDKPKDYLIEPLCLKLFKQRWYVLARWTEEEQPRIFSLDRIKGFIAHEDQHYKIHKHFNPEKTFAECYGVFIGESLQTEHIRLKVDALQAKYMRTLPLHSSQKEVEHHDDFSIFEFFLRPYFDFRQEILSYGSSVEVLSPEHFRNEIKEELEKSVRRYTF